MIDRFSHITRLAIIGILFTGFTAHLAIPFFGDAKKTAFTQWLNHKVLPTGDTSEAELRDRIRNLPKEASNFWMLVQDASKLISDHKDDFQIGPLSSDQKNKQVSSWLIGQWSSFNSHNSSTNAVLPEIVKPFQKWITQTDPGAFLSATAVKKIQTTQFQIEKFYDENQLFRILPPLVSGISINAP